jgi:exonuclease III
MKILSWNCRGLKKATAIRALLDVISRRIPDVIFLLETHLDLFPAEMLRRQLKMDFKEVVCSDGRSGGLILFWKQTVTLTVRDRTKNFIDVIIGIGQENAWRFTGMYGEPRWENKHLTWERLRELNQFGDSPWLVMGDLNDILYPFEKEGGRPRPNRCMKAFRDCLEDCHLMDVGYTGDKFT